MDDGEVSQLYHFWFYATELTAICQALHDSGGSFERAISSSIQEEWLGQSSEQN